MQITIEGDDRSGLYTPEELDGIEIEMLADQGQVGIGTAPVPTYTPSEEAYSGQQCLIESDGVTILDGFIGAMNRDRNGTLSGTRLTFHYGILDENALLAGHRAVGWVRPSETDRARILAAEAAFLSHLSLDTSMVLSTNLETLPAKTYMTEDIFGELQTDCGDPTAKDIYIENRRLHWHRQNEGDTAGLTIVASGANRTTTFELDSASPPQRSKDGMDLGLDVLARNGAGDSYTTDDAPGKLLHDSAGMRHERLIEQDGATLAQLTVLADRMLATYKAERITYEGTIGPLTSAQVDLLRPGMVITATDAVWGLTASAQRIAGVRLKYKHPDQWMATLSLGYAPRLRVKPVKETADSSAGTGRDTEGGKGVGGKCEDCPPFVPCAEGGLPPDYTVYEELWRYVPGAGAWDNVDATSQDLYSTEQTSPVGGTPNPEYVRLFKSWPIPAGASGATLTFDLLLGTLGFGSYSYPLASSWEIRLANWGAGPPAAFTDPQTLPLSSVVIASDTVDPTVLNPQVEVTVILSGPLQLYLTGEAYEGPPVWVPPGPDPGTQTDPYHEMHIEATLVDAEPVWLYGTPCTGDAPSSGQLVADEASTVVWDSVIVADATTYPFMPGSLRIEVNGVDATKAIATQNPTTGAFTLTHAPKPGSELTRTYRAA